MCVCVHALSMLEVVSLNRINSFFRKLIGSQCREIHESGSVVTLSVREYDKLSKLIATTPALWYVCLYISLNGPKPKQ